TPDDLHRTYPDWDFQLVTDLRDVVHEGGPATTVELTTRPFGGMVARWLLLAALVLLLVEVVLAWRFGHHTAVAGAIGSPPAPRAPCPRHAPPPPALHVPV